MGRQRLAVDRAWSKGPSRSIAVPSAVVAEVLAGPPTDAAHQALAAGWAPQRPDVAVRPEVLEWGLGAGETAVLSAVLSTLDTAVGVIDDGAARNCARALGVRVIGTLGVVLRAKVTGRIDSAAAVLRALRSAGFYLDTAIVRDALLKIVGESWEE